MSQQHHEAASNEHRQYDEHDLGILHEIVALATSVPGNHFRAVWRAYDTVLVARGVDPAIDSFYYRFILEMEGVPGRDLREKFMVMLDKLGVDVHTAELPEPSEELTMEYNRARFEDLREQREKVRQEMEETDEEEEEEGEGYDASPESSPKRAVKRRIRQLEVRASRKTGQRSPTEVALNAANEAAADWRVGVQRKRAAAALAAREELLHRQEAKNETEEEEDHEEGEHDDESIVVPAVQIPDDVADGLFALRQRKVLRRYLAHWRSRAAYFEQSGLLAEERYDKLLVARVWIVWVRQTAAIVQRSHEVRQRILARKYFNAWKAVVARNEEMVRDFQLSKVFYRWMDIARQRREDARRATQFYEEGLLRATYWYWFHRLCGVLAERNYEQRLVVKAFDTWAVKAERQEQLDRMAEAFFRRRTLQAVFAGWVQRTEQVLERQDLAYDYSDWRVMNCAFEAWRRQAKLAPLYKSLKAYSDDRAMYEHFSMWRIRTKSEVAAGELFKQKLGKKMFKNWRLVLRQRVIEEHRDEMLMRDTMAHWIREERLKLLRRTNNRRHARQVIQLFVTQLRARTERLRAAHDQALALKERNLKCLVLTSWSYRLNHNNAMTVRAELQYESTLASKALTIWRSRNDQYQKANADAMWGRIFFAGKHALQHWKAIAKDHRDHRLRENYRRISRLRKQHLAAKVLKLWHERTGELLERQHMTADMKVRILAHEALTLWRDRHQLLRECTLEAEEVNARRLFLLATTQWNIKLQRVQDLTHVAQEWRKKALYRKFIRRLEEKYWALGPLDKKAERHLERKQFERRVAMFRTWRSRLSARRRPDDSDEPPRVSTPVATSFSTPRWKTSGLQRRGLFASSVGGMMGPMTPLGSPGSPLKRVHLFGRSTLSRHEEDEDGEGTLTLIGSGSRGSRSRGAMTEEFGSI